MRSSSYLSSMSQGCLKTEISHDMQAKVRLWGIYLAYELTYLTPALWQLVICYIYDKVK